MFSLYVDNYTIYIRNNQQLRYKDGLHPTIKIVGFRPNCFVKSYKRSWISDEESIFSHFWKGTA